MTLNTLSVRLNKNGSISIRGRVKSVSTDGVSTMYSEVKTIKLKEGEPAYLLLLEIALTRFGVEWFGTHTWNNLEKPVNICHFRHGGYLTVEAMWRLLNK